MNLEESARRMRKRNLTENVRTETCQTVNNNDITKIVDIRGVRYGECGKKDRPLFRNNYAQ